MTKAESPCRTVRPLFCLLCRRAWAARLAVLRRRFSARTTARAPLVTVAATRPSTLWGRTPAVRTSTARCAARTAPAALQDTDASRVGVSARPRWQVVQSTARKLKAAGCCIPFLQGEARGRSGPPLGAHLTHRGFSVRTVPTVTRTRRAVPPILRYWRLLQPSSSTPAVLTSTPSAATTGSTAVRAAHNARNSNSAKVIGAIGWTTNQDALFWPPRSTRV